MYTFFPPFISILSMISTTGKYIYVRLLSTVTKHIYDTKYVFMLYGLKPLHCIDVLILSRDNLVDLAAGFLGRPSLLADYG